MNRRTIQVLVLGVALAASLAWAMTELNRQPSGGGVVLLRPTTAPTTQTAAATSADGTALLPPQYAILQSRNAFGRERGGKAHGLGGPEATFVFKGAVQAGELFTAFVEDLSSRQVKQLTIGDSLARGRIKSIDLDSIEYEVSGNSRQIALGQNFNGEVVPPTSQPTQAAPTAAPASPDGMPPGMALPPGMSPADLAAMMQQQSRARRRQ